MGLMDAKIRIFQYVALDGSEAQEDGSSRSEASALG